MASVAELKAGECDWDFYLVKRVGLPSVKRIGRKEGPRNTKVNLSQGRSAASGPVEHPAGVAAAAWGPGGRDVVAWWLFLNRL